jgi:hypothetical protein
MPLMQLTQVGGGAYGVALPKDDLRELGLLDEDDERQETTLRVEEIVPGVFMVAPTATVQRAQFDSMKFAAYEAAERPAPA